MKNTSFKKLSEQERKALLIATIAKRTNGRLSKTQLEYMIRDLPTEIQYTIKVISDAKEFLKYMTLPNHEFKHSWAGKTTVNVTDFMHLLLNHGLVPGENYQYEYSDNGNIVNEEERITLPDFNVNLIYAVSLTIHSFSDFNNNHYDTKDNFIYIYVPSHMPFTVSAEVKYILDNFNIE